MIKRILYWLKVNKSTILTKTVLCKLAFRITTKYVFFTTFRQNKKSRRMNKEFKATIYLVATFLTQYVATKILDHQMNLTNINNETIIILLIISNSFLIAGVYYVYSLLQEKIKSLKEFRDYEAIFMANRLNESLEAITKKIGITHNVEEVKSELYKLYSLEIQKYNKSFEDWKMGDYSIGDKSTVAEHKK